MAKDYFAGKKAVALYRPWRLPFKVLELPEDKTVKRNEEDKSGWTPETSEFEKFVETGEGLGIIKLGGPNADEFHFTTYSAEETNEGEDDFLQKLGSDDIISQRTQVQQHSKHEDKTVHFMMSSSTSPKNSERSTIHYVNDIRSPESLRVGYVIPGKRCCCFNDDWTYVDQLSNLTPSPRDNILSIRDVAFPLYSIDFPKVNKCGRIYSGRRKEIVGYLYRVSSEAYMVEFPEDATITQKALIVAAITNRMFTASSSRSSIIEKLEEGYRCLEFCMECFVNLAG